MLTEKEIYALGKNVMDENKNEYYSSMGSDVILHDPEKFIAFIQSTIERLERIKNFAVDYKKTQNEKSKEDDPWI